MEAGTEYDGTAIIGALKAGYAVAVTDYQGYTNGSVAAYSAGKGEGNDVLDIARAAREVPESGITGSNPVLAWGYSIGGQAVSWAGEIQPTYAPDVKLIGVATGGLPQICRRSPYSATAQSARALRSTACSGSKSPPSRRFAAN